MLKPKAMLAVLISPFFLSACQVVDAIEDATAAANAAAAASSATTGNTTPATATAITSTLIAANNSSATVMVNSVADASFATILNGVRSTAGVAPLTYNAQLDEAAQSHSTDMLVNNYFSHTGLNGSTVEDRIRATGYVPTSFGENIAQGQRDETEVLTAWQNSQGHRENNERAIFTEFGLGVAGTGSQTTWTLVFGSQ